MGIRREHPSRPDAGAGRAGDADDATRGDVCANGFDGRRQLHASDLGAPGRAHRRHRVGGERLRLLNVVARGGVPGSAALRRFAAAVARGSGVELETARAQAAKMGAEALVDAAAVAAFFNAFDRVADATGTIIDEPARDALAHLMPGVDIATTIGAAQPR